MDSSISEAQWRSCRSSPPGVYIAMNGRYFTWDNARKNRKTGEFEEIPRQ
jgi:hypothetical protein